MKSVQYTSDEHHSLKKAVFEGRLERVREIISSRSLYYSQEWSDASDGYALLCTAVQKKHTEIAKLLLTNGSRVNSENENPSETPLHFAVENGNIEIIQMLLDKNANINAPNICGRTPFHLALLCQEIEIIYILLNRGASVEPTRTCDIIPIHLAACIDSEELIILMLSKGANVNDKCADGKTAVYWATLMGYSRIVEHLLTHRAYVNVFDNQRRYTPLHIAATRNFEEIVQLLLSKHANVNAEAKDGTTSLHIAVNHGHQQIAEHLLKYGANVNAVTNTSGWQDGYTPLHLASKNGNEEMIKLLLSKGANVNAEAKDGMTSLHLATEMGHLKIAEHLLKYGANVNAVYSSDYEKGYTPLHIAADNDYPDVIKLLLTFGANVNSIDECGITALHIASKNGYEEIVMALLEHGTDTTIMSKKNYTALDFAMHPHVAFGDDYMYSNYGHVNVVKILKRHMLKIKAANLYAVNKDILSTSSHKFGSDDEELSDFQNKCEKEIASMKSEVINDNITFYDILTRSVHQVAIYVTNESVVEVFGSDNYKIKFPIYASMINRNFRKGEKEKEFMEKGDAIFYFLFSKNLPRLPPDCTEKILSYLNYRDLI